MEKEKLLKNFGLRLKELRRDKGVSQETLAGLCGLDRTYISGIERGGRNPSLTCIFKVANGLNVEVEELIKGMKLEYEK